MLEIIDNHACLLSKAYSVMGLSRSGHKYLGQGSFATVMSDPTDPDVAIKIARYDFSGEYGGETIPQDGWLEYAMHCDTDSPHRLRVFSVELRRHCFVAHMERLVDHSISPEAAETWEVALFGDSSHPSAHQGSLGEFGAALERQYESSPFFIDCHSGNLMFRRDGTPVFSDPLVSHNWRSMEAA